jgi:hypothetical protein
MQIQKFGTRLFSLSALIAFANFTFSIVGYLLRGEATERFNQSIYELIIFQAIVLLIFYLVLYYLISRKKIIQPRLFPGIISLSLLICIFIILFSVPDSSEYSDYKSFAENKSVLPEYSVLIYIIYFSTKRWATGFRDYLILVILAVVFFIDGYRMPAIYYCIILLANFRFRTIIAYGSLFFLLIIYSQISRFQGLDISSDFVLFVATSNAFDTLYSGDLISSANSLCQYSAMIPASFLFHILPLPSELAFPYYQANILNCTPTPGGGILAGYISYLTNVPIKYLIYFSVLLFPFFIYLIRFIGNLNWLYIIVLCVFAFRGFNYGPIALIRPIVLTFILFFVIQIISNVFKSAFRMKTT